jgi:hypothetical protein
MNKEHLIQVRASDLHVRRIRELSQQTGMKRSEVMRSLIENAAIVQRPVLAGIIEVDTLQPGNEQ